ncbi:MAG: protein phosphatase 2C domain-containing protein, partial [Candidatus Micrarchaeota archaeon]
ISLVTIRPPFPALMPPPPGTAEQEGEAETTAPDTSVGAQVPAGEPQEAAPAAEAVQEDPSLIPALGFPFGNDSAVDAELEKHLPQRVDDRTALIRRTARNLRVLVQVGCTPGNAEHAAYAGAVAAMQASFTYDSIIGHATLIVDRELRRRAFAGEARIPPQTPVPADLQPAKEETQPGFDPSEAIFAELNGYEKNMLSAMMQEECTAGTVSSFRSMHPGERELLIGRMFANSWSGASWKRMHELDEILGSLCSKCGVGEATADELREAISDPAVLSQFQLSVVASVVGKKPPEITRADILAFGVWASSDPMTPEGRAALQAYAEANLDSMRVLRLAQKAAIPDSRYGDEDIALLKSVFGKKPEEKITRAEAKDAPRIAHYARKLNELRSLWMDTPYAERAAFWKSGQVDILTAGSLLHKLRFDTHSRLSREEHDLLEALHLASARDANAPQNMDVDAARYSVADNLTNHTYRGVAPNPYHNPSDRKSKEHLPVYTREIIALSEFGEHMLAGSLNTAARRQAEYHMLLDFLGAPASRVRFRLSEPQARNRVEQDPEDQSLDHNVPYLAMDGLGVSAPKIEKGTVRPNEDSFASARVVLEDGSVLLLDMVADGMGGHSQGENGGKKNGQVASGIAKDMFELAAAAGWLRTPDDVRRLMLSVDMAIVMEQIRKKPHPDTELAENNMGTTMSVNIQRGCDFWSVHCGDSLAKVLRGGNVVFSAQGHSSEYLTRLTCRQNAEAEIAGLWKSRGVDPADMDPRFRPEFERQVEARAEELLAPVLPKLKKNEVCSVLGVLPKFVHINNSDEDPGPIVLQRGDRTLIGSDGLEAVCDHEYHMVAEKRKGDLLAAAEELTVIARARPGIGPHQALCGCMTEGKREDDKTLIMRDAEAGFAAEGEQPFQWFKKRIWASPREFASSASLRMILETCSDQRTDRQAVLDIIDALIDAATSAPDTIRKDAFTVAIYSIFSIVARRDDREELLSTLVPKIGGWSGLIMKKLRTAPNSGPHKLAMVDFLHMCVPEGDFYPLTGAKNRDIALRAGELFSGTAAPPEALEAARQEWPKPIFPASSSGNNSPYSDLEGNPLPPESTRYLDSTVLEIYESTIVQDTAKSLGVLPRDLEIMLFYAYAGAGDGSFDAEAALDPHDHSFVSPYKAGAEADDLVAAVSGHLCATLQAGADGAENMLLCANLIYQLNEAGLPDETARSYAQALWHRVGAMDSDMPYYDMFANRARSLAARHGVSTS